MARACNINITRYTANDNPGDRCYFKIGAGIGAEILSFSRTKYSGNKYQTKLLKLLKSKLNADEIAVTEIIPPANLPAELIGPLFDDLDTLDESYKKTFAHLSADAEENGAAAAADPAAGAINDDPGLTYRDGMTDIEIDTLLNNLLEHVDDAPKAIAAIKQNLEDTETPDLSIRKKLANLAIKYFCNHENSGIKDNPEALHAVYLELLKAEEGQGDLATIAEERHRTLRGAKIGEKKYGRTDSFVSASTTLALRLAQLEMTRYNGGNKTDSAFKQVFSTDLRRERTFGRFFSTPQAELLKREINKLDASEREAASNVFFNAK